MNIAIKLQYPKKLKKFASLTLYFCHVTLNAIALYYDTRVKRSKTRYKLACKRVFEGAGRQCRSISVDWRETQVWGQIVQSSPVSLVSKGTKDLLTKVKYLIISTSSRSLVSKETKDLLTPTSYY